MSKHSCSLCLQALTIIKYVTIRVFPKLIRRLIRTELLSKDIVQEQRTITKLNKKRRVDNHQSSAENSYYCSVRSRSPKRQTTTSTSSLLPAIRQYSEGRGICFTVCLFFFVCSVNDFSATRGPIHAIFCMRAQPGSGRVFSPFGGWRPPVGGKRGK